MSQFQKAKQQAITACMKEMEKRIAKGYDTKYDARDLVKLQDLTAYPIDSIQLKDVDVAYKAKIAKAHLSELFPENTFSVRIDRYSMGSSIEIAYEGPEIAYQQRDKFEHLYADSGKTELQSDYFDYDNHCSIHREIPLAQLIRSQK